MATQLPVPFKLKGSSERALFSFGFVTIFLFIFAQSCYCVSIGEVAEPMPQIDDDKPPGSVVASYSESRVKRSRDGQQLCGFRLIGALQSVCNRNFVGFVRRSDPFFVDEHSGEEIANPWEMASLMSPDTISNNLKWDGLPIQDFLEPRATYGSKMFALKVLSEPPKTYHRFRRSIIDECCNKPCVPNQMLKYCGMTSGK